MLFWIIFIIVVSCLFSPYGKTINRIGNLSTKIGFVFVTTVSAIRFDVGYDYFAYYKMLIPHLHQYALDRIEPLSKIIFYVADFVNWPPMLFIIYSMVTCGLVFYALKNYSKNYYIAVLTYISFFFLSSIDTIRQGLAIGIILFAYRYLVSNKLKYYLLCCLIAYLFHKASLICIFIPIIYKYFTLKRLLLFIAFVFAIYKSTAYIFSSLLGFEHYIDRVDSFSGGTITKYVFVIINIFLLWFTRNKSSLKIRKLVYITTIGAIFPFILGGHIGGRLAWFFLCYFCFIIPSIVNRLNFKARYICAVLLCIYFILNVYITTLNIHKSPYTPYQTILQIDVYRPHFKKIKNI